jgi:hypothetical protein
MKPHVYIIIDLLETQKLGSQLMLAISLFVRISMPTFVPILQKNKYAYIST